MATVNDTDRPQAKPKSNTKLFVFLGLGCLIPVLACGGCLGLGFLGITTALKSSEPYTQSLAAVQDHPGLQASLGTPIDAGMPMGNISVNNDDGEADISYTATGPNGSAQVHVVGVKTNGVWDYSVMTATANGETIDLLQGANKAAVEEPTNEPVESEEAN